MKWGIPEEERDIDHFLKTSKPIDDRATPGEVLLPRLDPPPPPVKPRPINIFRMDGELPGTKVTWDEPAEVGSSANPIDLTTEEDKKMNDDNVWHFG